MGEINKYDLISQEALKTPLELANNLDKTAASYDHLIDVAKKLENQIANSKSIGELAKQTDALKKSQTDLDKLQKETASRAVQRNKDEIKSLDDLVKKREVLRNTIKSYEKDQKEDLALLKQHIITRQEYNKRILESQVKVSQYREQIVALNRDVKNEILLSRTVGNEYKQLTIQLERARLQYKNMAASGQFSSKVLADQANVVSNLNGKVSAIDKVVGQFGRNVGNYPATFQAAATGLKSFLGAFGIVAGIGLFAQTLRGVISLTVDYGKKNSELQAVLGATASQTQELREQQLLLGKSTAFNAVQVTDMQIELAKLGFTTKEIKDLTASTLDASLALGSDLGRQAALTGAALKAFRLPASEAARVNDVLAKAAASSALSFSQLETAIPIVAPVAAAFGFTIEDVTALLGELANAGFDASMAATATRNIILNLADANGKLAKSLEKPVTDLPSLLAGLKQLDKQGIDLATSLELTDKRSVAAFQTFIAGTDSVKNLKQILDNASGSARTMAKVMQDNLAGDTRLASSVWQGLILSLTEGDSLFNRVARSIVNGTTAMLRFITPVSSATKELKKEQAEMNNLVDTITRDNISKEARRQLIEELNTKYPEFLKNLNIEKVSNEELVEAQKKANLQYEKKIFLKAAEASLIKTEEKRIAAIDKEVDLQQELEAVDKAIAIQKASQQKQSLGSFATQNALLTLEIRKQALEEAINALQEDQNKLLEERNRKQSAYEASLKRMGLDTGTSNNKPFTVNRGNRKAEVEKETNELLKFQLEYDVKYAKSVRDRVYAEIALELFKKGELLRNEKLTQDERLAIIARSQEAIKDFQAKGRADDLGLRIEAAIKAGVAEQEIVEQKMQQQIDAVKRAAVERGVITEQDEKNIADIKKKYADDIIKKHIDTVKAILQIEGLSAEERAKYEKALADYKIQLTDAYYDQLDHKDENYLAKLQRTLTKVGNAYNQLSNKLTQISNDFARMELSNLDRQQKALEKKTKLEIADAGNNDDAKRQIQIRADKRQDEIDRKRVDIQRRQARFEKAAALAQASINVAESITAALKAGPVAGQILAALTAALGAVQIGIIASQPLPQYQFGTGSAKGGKALVSEVGSELVIPKQGNPFLTPINPTIMDIPKGAEVIPHDETMRRLAYSSIQQQAVVDNENAKLYSLFQSLKENNNNSSKKIVSAIYKASAGNLHRQGSELYNHIIDENGNKKIVRAKSMGKI